MRSDNLTAKDLKVLIRVFLSSSRLSERAGTRGNGERAGRDRQQKENWANFALSPLYTGARAKLRNQLNHLPIGLVSVKNFMLELIYIQPFFYLGIVDRFSDTLRGRKEAGGKIERADRRNGIIVRKTIQLPIWQQHIQWKGGHP